LGSTFTKSRTHVAHGAIWDWHHDRHCCAPSGRTLCADSVIRLASDSAEIAAIVEDAKTPTEGLMAWRGVVPASACHVADDVGHPSYYLATHAPAALLSVSGTHWTSPSSIEVKAVRRRKKMSLLFKPSPRNYDVV
jgi:hypothetical protein